MVVASLKILPVAVRTLVAVEVIKNLDMLQNWDIVSPGGPDLSKVSVLKAQTTTGVNHVN